MFHTILNAQVVISGHAITWREIIGNLFGLASAFLGLRRLVWAWPVGIVGNVLLFTVFLGGVFGTPGDRDLYGQAGRQVFFLIVSVYGWWRWSRKAEEHEASDGRAIMPRWATNRDRLMLVGAAIVLTVVFTLILGHLNSFNPPADAWILTGSILATYGMARGWVEFWLIWILVDLVGVPLLLRAHLYPSAFGYIVYGALCIWGVISWSLTNKRAKAVQDREVQNPVGVA